MHSIQFKSLYKSSLCRILQHMSSGNGDKKIGYIFHIINCNPEEFNVAMIVACPIEDVEYHSIVV